MKAIEWLYNKYNSLACAFMDMYMLVCDIKNGRYKMVTCLNCQKTYFTDTSQQILDADSIIFCSQDCINQHISQCN